MRIAINCRSFLKANYTGIGRYAFNLVQSLSKIDGDNAYYLYTPKGLFDSKRQAPKAPSPNFYIKRDVFKSGLTATLGGVDIYHSPSPDLLDIEGTKVIVTVHDLIYRTHPQAHTADAIQKTEQFLNEAVRKAAKIICCSQSTREDLHKFFHVDRSKTCLIYQGVDKNEFAPVKGEELEAAKKAVQEKGIDGPYILFVGTIEPRKNLNNLLRAVAILKSQKKFKGKLVVAGMKGWKNEGLSGLVKQCRLENDVIFLGFVTNRELCYLYNLAEVFVFPSFYEGFGFPIVEAFSCRAAVVTSNVSACPEVAGDAALIIDPNSPQEIAEAICKITEDGKLEEQLRERALKRSEYFSFIKTAEETLKVYKDVANAK